MPGVTRLVGPTARYRNAFLRAIEEMAREDKYYARERDEARRDFAEYLRKGRGYARGKFLRKGIVPWSRFWLVEGRRVVGLIAIRHRLTKKLRRYGGHIGYIVAPSARRKGYGTRMLKLALSRARKLGLKRVLITCSPRNRASRKIIERNGGVLKDTVPGGGRRATLRYWLNLI